MKSRKLTNKNSNDGVRDVDSIILVRGGFYNQLKDDFDAHIPSDGVAAFDTIAEKTADAGVTIDGALIKDGTVTTTAIIPVVNIVRKTAYKELAVGVIVGTAVGDLGHAAGAEIVAAPGAGKALQFLSAAIVYEFDTAAYTGAIGDDLTMYQNSVAVSPAIATADLITKAGDTVISLPNLATDLVLGVNSNLNLACTAVTQPGTAAGVIRVYVEYLEITTGL